MRVIYSKSKVCVYCRQRQYNGAQQALSDRDIELAAAGNDLAALTDIQSRNSQLTQQHIATVHEFKLALGIAPELQLSLAPLPAPGTIDAVQIQTQIDEVAKRRPDLLALQAGYASQEAKLRQEILAQYPGISIGISRARDTSAVYTSGFNIALRLPIFSGNRPAIALEHATREQLYQEYRARLASDSIDISRLLQLQRQIDTRQQALAQQLPLLAQTARGAEAALQRGDFDNRTRNAAELTWLNARLEQIDLERSGWENRITLETLLAWAPPIASSESAPSGDHRQ
jgi:outer membrane protein TolC